MLARLRVLRFSPRRLSFRRCISTGTVIEKRDDKRKTWVAETLRKIESLEQRKSTTPLFQIEGYDGKLPSFSEGPDGIDLYMKDEASHPSGSLKHRLARSLYLHALSGGVLQEGMAVVEASSGSTAISEAWYARRLGLDYIAVLSEGTSQDKIDMIESLGGKTVRVKDASAVYDKAKEIVKELNDKATDGFGAGGYYLDQFGHASIATDWRGNNNLATSIFSQMEKERYPIPAWIVVGAGTGGTATSIGRYLGYYSKPSKLCVVDPEDSVFYHCYETRDRSLVMDRSSRIEGIGRPRVEPSFSPEVIDRMHQVPDAASLAAMRHLRDILGSTGPVPGASTGTNLYGCIKLIDEMRREGRGGCSIVSLICDDGRRYERTYYNDEWLKENDIDIQPYLEQIRDFWATGVLRSTH